MLGVGSANFPQKWIISPLLGDIRASSYPPSPPVTLFLLKDLVKSCFYTLMEGMGAGKPRKSACVTYAPMPPPHTQEKSGIGNIGIIGKNKSIYCSRKLGIKHHIYGLLWP